MRLAEQEPLRSNVKKVPVKHNDSDSDQLSPEKKEKFYSLMSKAMKNKIIAKRFQLLKDRYPNCYDTQYQK